MLNPVGVFVACTVDFHRQSGLGAVEIENVRSDRVLASEFEAAQGLPTQADP